MPEWICLTITGGMCRYTRQGHNEPGYFQDMSSAIKKAVSIPVMLTGGVKTLEDAETLLKNNAADLSLPVKARLGIEAKVPQCTKRTTCTLSTLLSLNAELVA